MKPLFYQRIAMLLTLCIFSMTAFAQKGVVIGGVDLAPSAILEMKSDSQGMLLPRMTTLQRDNNVISPANGLLIYNEDNGIFNKYYDGTWTEIDSDWSRKLNTSDNSPTANNDIYHLDGNVAIGSDNTSKAQLYINHNGYPALQIDDENGDEVFRVHSNGNVGIRGVANSVDFRITGKSSGNTFTFIAEDSDGNNDFAVGSDGRIGVGDVATSTRFNIQNTNNEDNSFLVQDSAGNNDFQISNEGNIGVGQLFTDVKFNIRNTNNESVSFLVEDSAGNNDFRISNEGNIGVGQSFDDVKFNIRNTNDESVSFLVEDSAGNNDFRIGSNGDISTGSGNIGLNIGATSNTDLKIRGKANNDVLILAEDEDGSDVFSVEYNAFGQELFMAGSASKPGGGEWSGISDRRLKRDITDYSEGLDFIKKIRPVWYTYNGKANTPDGEKHVGIIAQEVQKYAPYMVKEMQADEKDGISYLSVNTSAMKYMLINAVQEQQEQIETLQTKYDELLQRLEALEKK